MKSLLASRGMGRFEGYHDPHRQAFFSIGGGDRYETQWASRRWFAELTHWTDESHLDSRHSVSSEGSAKWFAAHEVPGAQWSAPSRTLFTWALSTPAALCALAHWSTSLKAPANAHAAHILSGLVDGFFPRELLHWHVGRSVDDPPSFALPALGDVEFQVEVKDRTVQLRPLLDRHRRLIGDINRLVASRKRCGCKGDRNT